MVFVVSIVVAQKATDPLFPSIPPFGNTALRLFWICRSLLFVPFFFDVIFSSGSFAGKVGDAC